MSPPNLAAFAACPDCDSDVGELVEQSPGFYVIEVRHDPTCPRYRAITERQT